MTDLETLQRQVKTLRLIVLAMVVALGAIVLAGFAPAQRDARFDTISAQRIDILEPDGKKRLVLSNAALMPPPERNGKIGVRNPGIGGVIFYDASGGEVGGIATVGNQYGDLVGVMLDYQGAEATGLVRRINADGSRSAGFYLQDPLPPGKTHANATAARRVDINNEGGVATVALGDAAGKPRLRLSVAADGAARIEGLDADGKSAWVFPRDHR